MNAEIKKIIASPFSPDVPQNLAPLMFPDSWEPFPHPVTEKKGPHTITRIGQIRVTGARETKIDVLSVRVAGDIHLRNNRAGLRALVDGYMDGIGVSGVLAFYYQEGNAEWRLSYAWKRSVRTEGETKIVNTRSTRCTYVLGPDSRTRTAADRFSALAENERITPADIERAFSVEAVGKAFFDSYRNHYKRFVEELSTDAIRKLLGVSLGLTATERLADDKPIRDFSKKLMGRLVFLKFIEKKGWLGASNYAARDGDPDFLMNLFKSHRENFYAEALVPLFFETLNTPRADDLFMETGTKVPYLNGGLFEPEYDVDAVNRKLHFKGGLFEELLDFFNQYNFTIDENDDSDAEVGVDPEMLGRIFEQLIEDNEKDMQGTIYTPFEVVRFMCRHSLLLHLSRKLAVEPDSADGKAIKALIVDGDVASLSETQKSTLIDALKTIKILDPAIGSGAFPMGMLRELLHARSVLEKTDDAERLKREIIRDSIYGVDIDPGAVDIARLRFFLSLVVDAKLPEPLPNLDFKIMQGDSLSEAFDDVPVVFDAAEYRKHQLPASDGLFESGELERLNKRKRKSAAQIMKESGVDVLALLAEYYDPERSHDKKKQSREAIEDLELDTVRRALEGDIAEKQAEYEKLDLKARRNPKPSTEKARDKAGDALALSRERLARLDEFEASSRRERPWFLWHYYFHDVFESGGFDIIIGNPPYRANQENENDQAKNKVYPLVYQRIKDTFVATSTAQKTKVYDLFSCFFRVAMDFALASDRRSIVSFITNYAFIGARTYDGFRKDVRENFGRMTVVNLGGDVRSNPRLSGPVNSIFGIQAGVAISFIELKKPKQRTFKLLYTATEEEAKREEKIDFISRYDTEPLPLSPITPDDKENWINQSDSDFHSLMPVCSKEAKSGTADVNAIFEIFSLGIVTARDEWVYDFDETIVNKKIKWLINQYNAERESSNKSLSLGIKWTRAVKKDLDKKIEYQFSKRSICKSLYRPYIKKFFYYSKELNEMRSLFPKMYVDNIEADNSHITIDINGDHSFTVHSSNLVADYHSLGDAQCLPLYRYESGKRVDNITDWALGEFRTHYGDASITKEDIFHYVYAVLHNPAYRKKYEIDLKQDYPRVPYYKDFARWRDWGKELMELHIGFETVREHPGIETVLAPAKAKETKTHSAGYAKDGNGDRVFDGTVTFCDGSGLKGIPAEAFDYRLGNKSAIEWILDQYVAPSYPTEEEVLSGKRKIREDERVLRDNFNTFRFADYKDKVIDLIKRVTTVSLRTVEVQKKMEQEEGM